MSVPQLRFRFSLNKLQVKLNSEGGVPIAAGEESKRNSASDAANDDPSPLTFTVIMEGLTGVCMRSALSTTADVAVAELYVEAHQRQRQWTDLVQFGAHDRCAVLHPILRASVSLPEPKETWMNDATTQRVVRWIEAAGIDLSQQPALCNIDVEGCNLNAPITLIAAAARHSWGKMPKAWASKPTSSKAKAAQGSQDYRGFKVSGAVKHVICRITNDADRRSRGDGDLPLPYLEVAVMGIACTHDDKETTVLWNRACVNSLLEGTAVVDVLSCFAGERDEVAMEGPAVPSVTVTRSGGELHHSGALGHQGEVPSSGDVVRPVVAGKGISIVSSYFDGPASGPSRSSWLEQTIGEHKEGGPAEAHALNDASVMLSSSGSTAASGPTTSIHVRLGCLRLDASPRLVAQLQGFITEAMEAATPSCDTVAAPVSVPSPPASSASSRSTSSSASTTANNSSPATSLAISADHVRVHSSLIEEGVESTLWLHGSALSYASCHGSHELRLQELSLGLQGAQPLLMSWQVMDRNVRREYAAAHKPMAPALAASWSSGDQGTRLRIACSGYVVSLNQVLSHRDVLESFVVAYSEPEPKKAPVKPYSSSATPSPTSSPLTSASSTSPRTPTLPAASSSSPTPASPGRAFRLALELRDSIAVLQPAAVPWTAVTASELKTYPPVMAAAINCFTTTSTIDKHRTTVEFNATDMWLGLRVGSKCASLLLVVFLFDLMVP